jgi:hypothetical protein
LTASGIFWKEDEVRRRKEERVEVVQRIPLHTIQIPHHHLIYIGIQEGERRVESKLSKVKCEREAGCLHL